MASILFLAKDLPNAGRVEGDPVSVKGDRETVTTPSGTWHWSAEEDITRWVAEGSRRADFPDLFYVVNIPGLSKRKAKRIMQPRRRRASILDPEFQATDREDRMVEVERHRWNINLSRMTATRRDKLRGNRRVTLPNDIAVLNDYVRDRTTRVEDKDVWITDTPKDPTP